MMDTKTSVESETDYEDFKDLGLEITNNNILLLDPCSTKDLVSEDIVSMVKFNMMQSSPLADLAGTTID